MRLRARLGSALEGHPSPWAVTFSKTGIRAVLPPSPSPDPKCCKAEPIQTNPAPAPLGAALGSHPHLHWAAASTSRGGADSCRPQVGKGSF